MASGKEEFEEPDGPVLWGPQGLAGQSEWFVEDQGPQNREGSRAAQGKALVNSVGSSFSSMFAGAWGAGGQKDEGRSMTVSAPGSGGKVEASLQESIKHEEEVLADSHCLDCSYEWQVPIEIEPGRYLLRICPTGTGPTHRYSSNEQLQRSRESGWFNIA